MRVAPNSKESEMMVLGCMLTSINSLNIAADALDDSDFYYTEHKIIFGVLKMAYRNDRPADIHLVAEELKRMGKLASVGGVSYVTTLAQYAGTSAYIEEYVQLVKNKSILRRMISAAEVVEKHALEEPEDVYGALDEAQTLFYKISQAANSSAGILLKEILLGIKAESNTPFLKELEKRQELFQTKGPQDPGITGTATHFIDLDKLINGLNKSNLMIVAARPAMGKTSFALGVAENVCFKNNIPVGIFSLEMSAEQLLHRIICSQAEVESDKIKTGSLNGMEFQRIVSAVNHMQQFTMVIDDQPGLKITDLRARARRMKETHDIGLLVIDYLQLLSGSGTHKSIENRQNEISEISRMLKNLARELNIPVICLSQLSRKVEDRQGHRPMMSDLRESGCLTGDSKIQDAETGIFYTIQELAESKKQIFIHAIDKELKIGKHRMIKAFYSGKKKVFRLTTRSGRSIKASANHPFLKLSGWTALENLRPKDQIAIPRELSTEKSTSLQDQELCLLGHLLGDGCILPKQPYHYTSADPVNLGIVKEAAYQLFGIQGREVPQKNWAHIYLPSPFQLSRSKHHPITVWYSQMGIERVRSYHKKIPEAVFQADKRQIALFLHHLWGTDGNISSKKIKKRKESAAIYYASSSKELCNQVQKLLLRLGIQSHLATVASKKNYRAMHHVHIFGVTNQKKFLQSVGSSGQRGEMAKKLLPKLEAIESRTRVDVIPREAWSGIVKEAKQKHKMSWRAVCAGLQMEYCGSTLFKSRISRERMAALNKVMPTQQLQTLAQSDVFWDEIASIEELGIEDVYDATVENVHNFVANDIIVHNSIEQDADIVMFLLRREYYDPMDKPGMAELIVAKNRHGGVGSVNLTFRKEIAQFANYTPIKFGSEVNEAFKAFSND